MPPQNGDQLPVDLSTNVFRHVEKAPAERNYPTDPFPRNSTLMNLMTQWGLARDRQPAQYILIGLAVVAALIAIFFLRRAGGGTNPSVPQSKIDAAFRNGAAARHQTGTNVFIQP